MLLARHSDRAELDVLRRAGAVERLRRGAYVEVTPSRGPAQDARRRALGRIRAVAAQTTLDAWFSHESAALIWGLPVLHVTERTHVRQLTRPGRRGADSLVRHHGPLPDPDRDVVAGLPVTSLARTAVDCACTMPARDALVVLDGALRAGADPDALAAVLRARPRGRGVARARTVLALADGRAESPGESMVRWEMHAARLPDPVPQTEVVTRRGRYYLDLGWPDWRVGLEFDGRVKYSGDLGSTATQAVLAEKLRQEAIEDEGWHLVRTSWDEVLRHGREVAERVRRALLRATRSVVRA